MNARRSKVELRRLRHALNLHQELGSWSHLATRLVDTALARPLTDDESGWVEARLGSDRQWVLFRTQAPADQRHGHASGRFIEAQAPERVDLIRAALLHDVGKISANLGVVGRSLAEAAAKLGVNVGERFDRHVAHAEIGARLLEAADSDQLVVNFALHHHSVRPAEIDPPDWVLLRASDRARWRAMP